MGVATRGGAGIAAGFRRTVLGEVGATKGGINMPAGFLNVG